MLEILFDEDEPGCHINTNFVGGNALVQSYVRLKVRNPGRTTARNVSLCVTRLTFEALGGGVTTFEEEVLDLKVANTHQAEFRLAPGAHRYIDLFHTQNMNPGVTFSYDFVATPARLTMLGFAAGTYRAEVFASAENTASVSGTVSWRFDGTFPGLQIIGLS